jgi:hypothetical protein
MMFQIESFTGGAEIGGRMRVVRFNNGTLVIEGVVGIAEARGLLMRLANGVLDEDLVASSAMLATGAVPIEEQRTRARDMRELTNPGSVAGTVGTTPARTPQPAPVPTPATPATPASAAPAPAPAVPPAAPPSAPAEPPSAPAAPAPTGRGRARKAPAAAPAAPVSAGAPPEASKAPAAPPASTAAPEVDPGPTPDDATGELCGEAVPSEVMNASRWETVVEYLRRRGWESRDEIAEVCRSTFRNEVRLLRTVDPEFIEECVDNALANLAKPAGEKLVTRTPSADAGPVSQAALLDDAALGKFETLRPCLQYMLDSGVSRTNLTPTCEGVKEKVPVLKTIPNIGPRVSRMLEAMFGPGA